MSAARLVFSTSKKMPRRREGRGGSGSGGRTRAANPASGTPVTITASTGASTAGSGSGGGGSGASAAATGSGSGGLAWGLRARDLGVVRRVFAVAAPVFRERFGVVTLRAIARPGAKFSFVTVAWLTRAGTPAIGPAERCRDGGGACGSSSPWRSSSSGRRWPAPSSPPTCVTRSAARRSSTSPPDARTAARARWRPSGSCSTATPSTSRPFPAATRRSASRRAAPCWSGWEAESGPHFVGKGEILRDPALAEKMAPGLRPEVLDLVARLLPAAPRPDPRRQDRDRPRHAAPRGQLNRQRRWGSPTTSRRAGS